MRSWAGRLFGRDGRPTVATWLRAWLAAFALVVCASAASSEPVRIVALGDSNTAGFGVGAGSAYPAKLERALRARGYAVTVRNSGISGETTAGALGRLEGAVAAGTRIAIVFLGRNDMHLGVPKATTRRNIDVIVRRLRARGVRVILFGFYGYGFADIAAAHGASYAGDFFAGTAVRGVKKPQYDLKTGSFTHLNPAGYNVVVAHLLPVVERLLGRPRQP